MNVTFEEFKKTVYYTEKSVVLPLLNKRLNKIDYMIKGQLDFDLINSEIRKNYEENLKKFEK